MANVFDFENYKDFLKATIKENSSKRGFQTQLAKAAGCQTSYLSQVLSGKVHFMPDHAAGAGEFLELGEHETEFLITLVHLERAATARLRTLLQKRLGQLKALRADFSSRIANTTNTSAEVEAFYYSSWYWCAIHIATSVPKLQTVKALAETFLLPASKVLSCLERLEKFKLVERKNNKWLYLGGASHLRKDSVMTEANHSHWRQRAIYDIQAEKANSLHYTSVVSMSEVDVVRLREFLMQSIATSRKISDPSEPEVVMSLCLDLYEV